MAPYYEANPRFERVIELLNAQSVDCVLIGGWAFSYHATPRYTGHLDFFVRCDAENAARLKRVLNDFGFVDLSAFEESFLQPERILQFGLPPNRIDILTQIDGVTFEEAWNSRIQGDGVPVSIIGRDVLIKNKAAAGRPKDLADLDTLTR